MNKRIRKKQGREHKDMTGWNAPAWRGWFTRWRRAGNPVSIAEKAENRLYRNGCGALPESKNPWEPSCRKMHWAKLARFCAHPAEKARAARGARLRDRRRLRRAKVTGRPLLDSEMPNGGAGMPVSILAVVAGLAQALGGTDDDDAIVHAYVQSRKNRKTMASLP